MNMYLSKKIKHSTTLLIILFFILFFSLLFLLKVKSQKPEIFLFENQKAKLYLECPSNVSTTDSQFVVKVKVDTNMGSQNASIDGVDVELNFDNSKIEFLSINENSSVFNTFLPVSSSGSFLKNQVENGNTIKFGAAAFDWSSNSVQSRPSGDFKIAELVFKPLNEGIANFEFAPNRGTDDFVNVSVHNQDGADDILEITADCLVNISTPSSPSPSPSPSPSASPSPSPSTGPDSCIDYDINKDNMIDIFDILIVLEEWNINYNVFDLLGILECWGQIT